MYMLLKSFSFYFEYLLFICLFTCWEKVGQSWKTNLIFLKNGVLLVKFFWLAAVLFLDIGVPAISIFSFESIRLRLSEKFM